MQGVYNDLTGQRFGQWKVLHRIPGHTLSGKVRWLCTCDCGYTRPVLSFMLTSGRSTRCQRCGNKGNDNRWKNRKRKK